MADERVPFRRGRWFQRHPEPVTRGAEYGTPAPLVRGIRSRLRGLLGPSEDELAQWQKQVRDMQEAGFTWNEQKKMWQRGDLMVEPWAQPWMYPREEKSEKKG